MYFFFSNRSKNRKNRQFLFSSEVRTHALRIENLNFSLLLSKPVSLRTAGPRLALFRPELVRSAFPLSEFRRLGIPIGGPGIPVGGSRIPIGGPGIPVGGPGTEIRFLIQLHLELRPLLFGLSFRPGPGRLLVLPHFLEPRISSGSVWRLPFPSGSGIEKISVRSFADFLLVVLCVVVEVVVVGLGRELAFEPFRDVLLLETEIKCWSSRYLNIKDHTRISTNSVKT